jgi:tripartite-type tricarboxylate transporter receptor subunit TctC
MNDPGRNIMNRGTAFDMRMLFAAALAAALGCGTTADAQDYPSRPITMVVGYPPGGSTE